MDFKNLNKTIEKIKIPKEIYAIIPFNAIFWHCFHLVLNKKQLDKFDKKLKLLEKTDKNIYVYEQILCEIFKLEAKNG